MAECLNCGKRFGMLDEGDSIIAKRHLLCSKCYKRIASGANSLKYAYSKVSNETNPDVEAFARKCDETIQIISDAGYGQTARSSLIEDVEELKSKIANRKENEIKAIHARESKAKATANMLITSGFNFDGYTITKYSGYISGDDAVQIGRGTEGWFSSSNVTNVGEALTKALVKIRRVALQELKEAAYDLGCNAVIGVDYDYITLEPETANATGGTTYLPYVIAVTANGNAVVIEKNKESHGLDFEVEDEDEIELSPIQDPNIQLRETLEYACRFSTVDGVRKNLERNVYAFSDEDSQKKLIEILSVSDSDLLSKIKSVLAELN